MSRPLRIDVRGGWYHITARGHNRQPIYLDKADRLHFLERLGEMTERHHVEVHAYVMMDNHYHLLIRTPEANASPAMQWLNVSYSIWWNRRHGRCGSLFQGRFKAILVEGGGRVLRLSQYLHMNPVAVKELAMGKAEKASESRGWRKPTPEVSKERLETIRTYPWSSYRAYAGYEEGAPWLTQGEVLSRIRGGRRNYRKILEKRLRAGNEENPWDELKWGAVLGSGAFAEAIRAGLKPVRETSGRKLLRSRITWDQAVSIVERIKGESWKSFRDRHGDCGRDLVLWAARQWGGHSLAELAELSGGVDYTAVAQGIRRLIKRSGADESLRKTMKNIAHDASELSNVKT